ncbi:ion transporter [Sulfurihydrogenibium subterraneum]|uniref:ion transporter n=1 Tax=Sulfurihydrogenibium subterraneum TaxID=171121 RepID=UPI000491C898|nr:ion transporter [Sulfurihydrogenibium subterraneum]
MKKSKNKKYLSKIKRLKIFFYNVLENERNSLNHIYSLVALFIVITSSITVLLLITPESEKLPPDLHSFLQDFEEITLLFFAFEYILRWWVISDFFQDFKTSLSQHKEKNLKAYINAFLYALKVKLKWMLKPLSIIDLIAILPIFRPFRAIRIVQLLRILKIFRYSSGLKSVFQALKEQGFIFVFSTLMIFLNITVFSIIVYIYEYNAKNDAFKSLLDALYWGAITSFTVGYGDITPITDTGKIIASFMTFINIVLVSVLTAGFSVSFINRLLELKEGEVKMRDLENHIVICGYNETSEEILENIISLEIDKERPVVLITNHDKKDLDINLSYIIYKKGDFIKEDILMDVAINKASDVVIVGEKLPHLTDRDIDARTALAGMLIKTLNPYARLYVEVLLDEDAEIFRKRLGTKDILIHGQILGKIMFSSLLNPGATQLIETIIDNETGIRKVKVKEIGSFETFGEILTYIRKQDLMPIAVERNKKVILSPPDDFKVSETDYIFIIPSGETT